MYGLVLEGGGAKGSYHIGAYKALMELGIEIGGVAGTSIGALNGAAIVQGDFERLEQIWDKLDTTELFGLDEGVVEAFRNRKLQDVDLSDLVNTTKGIFSNKGLDTAGMRNILNDLIDEDKIRKSKLDFGIVTVSLSDKHAMELLKEEIPQGKMIDYLQASASLPGFKMEKMDGKLFVDGGVYDNLPISVLEKKGYKDFIAVRTFGIGRVKRVKKDEANIIYIQPVEELGKTIDFNHERTQRNIKLGYYDTMKVFKKLKGYKYYCYPYKGNFLKYLIEVLGDNEQKVLKIGEILGYEDIPYDRMIFEKIMPRLESIMELRGNYDYQDIFLRLIEIIAEKYDDIEQFKIYEADEFINLVINKFKTNPLSQAEIPAFLRHNKILSITVKDALIIDIFRAMLID